MSRTLYRPMFRRGGSAGEGITSGLSRQGYNRGRVVNPGGYAGDDLETLRAQLALIEQEAPLPKTPKSTASADFWLNLGTNILAQPGGRPILQTLGMAGKEPLLRYQQQRHQENLLDYKSKQGHRDLVADLVSKMGEEETNKLWKEAGFWFEKGATNPTTQQPFKSQEEAFNSLIQKSLMSKESFKTDEALYNETVETLFGKNLQDINFKGNNLGARTLAEHEAKVIHGQYPEELINQLDKQTTYIDSAYVNDDGQGNITLNDIGKNIGYRPNKIYFNISDESFYKLDADGITFTIVDIADFEK
jgi:hypothetical protein